MFFVIHVSRSSVTWSRVERGSFSWTQCATVCSLILTLISCSGGGDDGNSASSGDALDTDFSAITTTNIETGNSPLPGTHGISAAIGDATPMYLLVPEFAQNNDLKIRIHDDAPQGPNTSLIGSYRFSFESELLQIAIAVIQVDSTINLEVIECQGTGSECARVPIRLSSGDFLTFAVKPRHRYEIPVIPREEIAG